MPWQMLADRQTISAARILIEEDQTPFHFTSLAPATDRSLAQRIQYKPGYQVSSFYPESTICPNRAPQSDIIFAERA